MKYITFKRFKGAGLNGDVNIPFGTELSEFENMIYYDKKPLCYATSQNAHEHFARNDDGQGLQRGKLTQTIIATLSKKDDLYQDRWDNIWEDILCKPYRNTNFDDYWLWNDEFFKAEIDTLKYIANLIGMKERDYIV